LTAATPEDLRWLDAAVRYATPFLGITADTPTTAALVVDISTDTLVARAVTARNGRPHAEAQALERAGFEAAGCTLYVTIEPCHHWGRTPPCVDGIVRSGVMRVVIGVSDPDPRTAGESVKRLESAGIEVILANHAPSAALHAGHLHRHRDGRPFVTAMLAVSSDDRIVTRVTGPAADWLALQRARSDAILVGAATARGTDPQLTVRIPGLESRTPLRVVLAGAKGVDRRLNLIGGFSGYRTAIIAETTAPVDAPVSVEILRVTGTKGRPDLAAALGALAGKGIQNLLVEPGPRLAAALLEADLINCFALITTGSGASDGPPASPDGRIASLLDAAGLVAGEPQTLGADTLTLYRRPA
jgi:diaminohydroxyphosphoribosylaminopyrimidine deaminase / 5-amino-6-(5-phosphoribosylamino)uracil reductase